MDLSVQKYHHSFSLPLSPQNLSVTPLPPSLPHPPENLCVITSSINVICRNEESLNDTSRSIV